MRGEAIGCYAPVTTAIEQNGKALTTEMLYLGLWIETDNRIAVWAKRHSTRRRLEALTPVEESKPSTPSAS